MTKFDISIILKMYFSLNPILKFLEGKIMAKTTMPHPGHGQHLCYLTNLGYQISNPKEYKALVKGSKYLCKICGRVAASEKNLCKPVKL